MIDTMQMREAVQDKNYRNVLDGSTHYEGCEYEHYPCAVLALCDEVDRLKPISIAEQMPPEAEYVLLYDSLGENWTMGMLINGRSSGAPLEWVSVEGDLWHGNNFCRVTYWMPLPPEPEDEP